MSKRSSTAPTTTTTRLHMALWSCERLVVWLGVEGVWANHLLLLLQVVIADTVKAHLQERQERLQQIDALRDKVNALALAFDQRWDDV